MHAAPSLPNIAFLREQREETNLAFGAAGSLSFEVGQYDFNLEVDDPATRMRDRFHSFSKTLQDGVEYLFVLTEKRSGDFSLLAFEQPKFDSTSSNAEVGVVHAAVAQSALDVYLEAPGTDITTAVPFGTLDLHGNLEPATLTPGDYELSVTAAGNPADRLFLSGTLSVEAGVSYTLVVTDGETPALSPINVVDIGDAVIQLANLDAQSALRVVNATSDRLDRDLIVDASATPLFSALAFSAVSDFELVAPGARDLSVTPAGNPSVEELAVTLTFQLGSQYTALLAGDTNDLNLVHSSELRRPLANQARIKIYNGATQFDLIGFYILLPGVDPSTATPAAILAAPEIGASLALAAGDYELTLRLSTGDTIAGPIPVTIENGKVYGILAANDVGGSAAEIFLIDDFN